MPNIEFLDIDEYQLTNNSNVVSRIKYNSGRVMTTNERELVDKVFGVGTIDYDRVRIYSERFVPVINRVMAPDGNIYFTKDWYHKDFSLADTRSTQLFIHEMTHIWQYQLGYPVAKKGIFLHPKCTIIGCEPYEYTLDSRKRLCDYNMEQQGNIIADYYLYYYSGLSADYLSDEKILYNNTYKDEPQIYLTVLTDFIASPKDEKNLPKN